MRKKWTRRKFLETGLKGSIVVGGGATGVFSPVKARAHPQEQKPSASGLDAHVRELLRATMDEIIPASDGMQAASEVGGVEYLDRLMSQSPDIRKELEKSLAGVEELSHKQFGKDFISLSHTDRVEALKKLEKQAPPEIFANLRDYVYEAYYIQPKVWKLIAYEFYPTNQAGPRMKPFDKAVLAQVRKKPKFYRQAE